MASTELFAMSFFNLEILILSTCTPRSPYVVTNGLISVIVINQTIKN